MPKLRQADMTPRQAKDVAQVARFREIAERHVPPHTNVEYVDELTNGGLIKQPGGSYLGIAYTKRRTIRVPNPTTLKQLHTFLHECVHVARKHNDSKPRWLREYEADTHALDVMRDEGLETHPGWGALLKQVKGHTRHAVRKAVRRGATNIDPQVIKFAEITDFKVAKFSDGHTAATVGNQMCALTIVYGKHDRLRWVGFFETEKEARMARVEHSYKITNKYGCAVFFAEIVEATPEAR
jgi:hypothetical protein